MVISFIAVLTVKEKKIQDAFAGKADNKMLEHIVLAEIKGIFTSEYQPGTDAAIYEKTAYGQHRSL